MKNDDCDEPIELPEVPQIPESLLHFDPPPVPDISSISTMLKKLTETALVSQNNFDINGILSDFAAINQTFRSEIANLVHSFAQAIQNFWSPCSVQLREMAHQLSNAVANFRIPTVTEEEQKRLIESNQLWGQYGWTYIPSMPLKMYHASPENITAANKLAIKYCSDKEMNKLFKYLQRWKLHSADLDSAIFCFQNKQYKACALLLCGMIDSKLIRMQSSPARPVGANAVKWLIASYEDDRERLLVEVLFATNLFAYLEKLFAGGKGFMNEPDTLNRNYIGHGMNRRTVRKRDCIQLFLALNNLMQFLSFVQRSRTFAPIHK